MGRILAFLYSSVVYTLFLLVFVYLFGFVGDIFVPLSVSYGGEQTTMFWTVIINFALMALFGVQHSIMARPSFKRWFTQFVPKAIERSTFVLVTNIILIVTYIYWKPVPHELWNVTGTILEPLLWGVFVGGILLALIASFLINHFDLFGLRQAWLYLCSKEYTPVPFRVTGFYKWVRHPLLLGFLMCFWAAPVMTCSRLYYAAGMSLYIFIGIYFEERTTAEHLGEPYNKYKAGTSMIVPMPPKKIG